MDHILNIQAIKRKMKKKPQGQRLHNFFLGANTLLTKEEITEIERIIEKENKRVAKYLESAKSQPHAYA